MMQPSPYAFMVGPEGRQQVFFDPHPGKQREVLRLISERVFQGTGPSKFFLRGNRGGSKSYLMRRGALHGLAMAIPGLKYAVVRRNMPDLRSNHLIYLGAEMRQLRGDDHGWNETFGQAKYPNGSMGFYRQCEDERDVEKIVGSEVAILFVDEAPQIKWEYLRTMSPSLRVPRKADGTQPYWTAEVYGGNPIGESIEDLDRYFVDQLVEAEDDPHYRPDDWLHIPIHRSDNPSLDEAEYLKQFAGIPAHFRAAWIDGVRMDSRTLFEVQKTKDGKPYHYIQELPLVGNVPLLRVPWIQIYRAFDMGFFPDPAVCVWLAVVGKRIIAVHEETWFKTIAKDLAAKMIETTAELTSRQDAQTGEVVSVSAAMTYVDPQIAVKTGSDTVTVMDTLELEGVPCEPSINDRVLYADAIHGLLGEEVEPGVPRFQIYEPGCPMLAKYLPKYRWDEKNPRKFADHKFDHYGVCVAYFAISSGVLSLSAREETTQRPVWMEWMDEGRGTRSRRRVS